MKFPSYCFVFFSLNIGYFSLFFMEKLHPPLKKVTPSFSATSSKNWDPAKPPFLKNWSEAQPSSRKGGRGGRCTLCYSAVYILVSGSVIIDRAGNNDNEKQSHKRNKEVTFRNCVPFTDCISEINNTQIDNAKDLHVLMQMYNSIKHSNNY